MRKTLTTVFIALPVLFVAPFVYAQQAGWGGALKSVAQSAGQAAVQQLTPQAQKIVDESNKFGAPAKQEGFLITKAKEFMAAGNYQPALDLANYVMTMVNSKNVDAKKIMTDAKAALMKMAQDKLAQPQQVKTDATQAATGVKSLFGVK